MKKRVFAVRLTALLIVAIVLTAVPVLGFAEQGEGEDGGGGEPQTTQHTVSVLIDEKDLMKGSTASSLSQTVPGGSLASVKWDHLNCINVKDIKAKVTWDDGQGTQSQVVSLGTVTGSGTLPNSGAYTITRASNDMGFTISFPALNADIEITPEHEYKVVVETNLPSQVSINGAPTSYIGKGQSKVVSWTMTGEAELDNILVGRGEETVTVTSEQTTFTIGGDTYAITRNDRTYSIEVNDISDGWNFLISAKEDIFVGGNNFTTEPTVELVPFAMDSGTVELPGFGFWCKYETRADGSVLITHNAYNTTYHGGGAAVLYQSHYSGQVIDKLTGPLTVSVRLQCQQGCQFIDTASLTIPYRAVTFKAVDELGNEIKFPSGWQETCYVMDNRTWATVAPKINWYEYVPKHTANPSVAETATREGNDHKVYFSLAKGENGTITLKYKAIGQANFRYLDERGNPILFDGAISSARGYRGEEKEAKIPSADWYRFTDTSTETSAGETPSAELTGETGETVRLGLGGGTTFTRNYVATASVKVRYVDEKGNDLSPIIGDAVPYIISGDRDSVHDIAAPEIYSFEYAGMDISTPDGRMHSATLDAANKKITLNHEDASTVTVRYQGKASVKIRYIDDEFNDVNAIFKELEPDNIEFLKAGNRDDAFSVYHAEEIGDYSYDHMEIRLNGEYPLPEGKIIPPDALTSISATFDTNTGDGVLRLYDNAEITVVYNYRGTVWMRYQDEYGNDLVPRCDPTPPEFIEGYHKRTKEIPTPELDFFEFQRYELATREGERPSGYIDGPKDNTVTFGVRDASTITDRYRGWAMVNVVYVDENGKDISSVFGEKAVPSLKGYRDTEAGIPTPMDRWYEFQSYSIATAAGAECESGFIDGPDDSTVTFGLKDQSTITLAYRGRAKVKFMYMDEYGNDLSSEFGESAVGEMEGLRGDSETIPTSDNPWYELQGYEVKTTPGKEASCILNEDGTFTYGHRDGSTIIAKYRGRAEVKMRYVDENGDDITGLFETEPPKHVVGYRDDDETIPTPSRKYMNFSHYTLSTTYGSHPSGYIQNKHDETLTYGIRDASHIVVHYRAWAEAPVRYIDTSGRDLLAAGVAPKTVTTMLTGDRGESFELSVPNIDNYTLVQARLDVNGGPLYIANSETSVYHRSGCSKQGSGEDCIVMSAADMKNAGQYKACTECTPKVQPLVSAAPSVENFKASLLSKNRYNGRFLFGNGSQITVVYRPVPFKVRLVEEAPKAFFLAAQRGLGDGKFEVKDADNKTVYSGTTDNTGHIDVKALPEGKYTISQTSAPAGYYLNPKPLEITVDKHNTVIGQLKQEDAKIIKTVRCVDAETNVPLSGVRVGLYKDGALVSAATTGADGSVDFWLQGRGSYTIRQDSVPQPYVISNEVITQTITDTTVDDGNNTFTLRNTHIVQTGGEPLPYTAVITCAAALAAGAAGIWFRRRKKV